MSRITTAALVFVIITATPLPWCFEYVPPINQGSRAFLDTHTPSPVPRDAAPSHSTDTKSKKDDTTQNKPPAWSPSQRTDHNSEHPESETHTGETANNLVILRPESPKKDWWDYAGIAGGFFIALLTLGLAIIAWIQAKAAKASAEATINAERAWLLPVMVQPMLLDSPPGNEPQMCAIACKITNYGKTPARVFESVVKLHILNSGDALPEQPDYRTEGKAANSIPGEFVLRAGKGFDQILFTAPTHIAEIKGNYIFNSLAPNLLIIIGLMAFTFGLGIVMLQARTDTRPSCPSSSADLSVPGLLSCLSIGFWPSRIKPFGYRVKFNGQVVEKTECHPSRFRAENVPVTNKAVNVEGQLLGLDLGFIYMTPSPLEKHATMPSPVRLALPSALPPVFSFGSCALRPWF